MDKFKIILLICFIVFVVAFDRINNNNSKEFLNNYNVNFEGLIIKKVSLEHYANKHYGIVKLKVTKSDTNFLDERNKEYYFCSINGGFAEIVGGFFEEYDLGDLVKVNAKNKTISIYRKSILINVHDINMIDTLTPFGQEVRKRHEIFK